MNPTNTPNPAPTPAPAPPQQQPTPPATAGDGQSVRVKNPLNTMSVGERNIFEIHRHPIGMFGVYASFTLLVLLVGAATVLAPNILTTYNPDTVRQISLGILAFVVVFAGIFAWVAHIVYYGNRWILTSDSVTQIRRTSLFNSQNSQLSLGNLEDISAYQDGILAHMFNFGILRVETAGERSKFMLNYCPNPNEYARQILAAREAFEQGEHYRQEPDEPTTTAG
jgi:hypothetical protein